jgi:hypothetical protein
VKPAAHSADVERVRSGRRIGLAAEVTSADAMFENARWPFTESLECWMDGRPSIRIHSFDAASAPEVSRSFGQRYGAGTASPCSSGGELSPQSVVVGLSSPRDLHCVIWSSTA